jgi:hypothetical protein
MSTLKQNQLRYESDTWKRLLGFMTDENVHLKNRLADILKEDFSNVMLVEVEDFQNRFLKEDMIIRLLRSDIAELDKLLIHDQFADGRIAKEIEGKIRKLRNNISTAEELFGKLKLEFNSYMAENVE